MRMRKLGHGQSVIFCVSNEIQSKIRVLIPGLDGRDLAVSHIVYWALSRTVEDLQRQIQLWALQGKRYDRQQSLRPDDVAEESSVEGWCHSLLEPEAQRLVQRYRPGAGEISGEGRSLTTIDATSLDQIAERCAKFHINQLNLMTLEEEQERELAPEIEEERQVEMAAPARPLVHHLDNDLRHFIATGEMRQGSATFRPAFQTLQDTSAARHYDACLLPVHLYATRDFAQTVIRDQQSADADAYQRSVRWLLSRREGGVQTSNDEYLIIISPFEADCLLPDIQRSGQVRLHIYAPRSSLSLPTLEKLDLYPTPPSSGSLRIIHAARMQLNIFAGQLHCNDYEDYLHVCRFLQLDIEASGSSVEDSVSCPGLLKFVEILMTKIRRDCQQIGKTHLGKALDGQVLGLSDFLS